MSITTRRLVAPSLLIALSVVLAACASSAPVTNPPTNQPSIPPSTAPSVAPSVAPSASPSAVPVALLLRVTTEGGFIGPAATIASEPLVSVYADGRILTPSPIDAIYPSGFSLTYAERDLGPAGATAIITAIKAAGLDKPQTGEGGVVADTGTTVFAVTIDGVTTTSRFAGGAGGPGRPGGSGDPEAAAANDLLARLVDESDGWGGASPTQAVYTPTAIRIFAAPGGPMPDVQVSPSSLAWPLADGLDRFGAPAVPDRGITGLRSGVVFGADLPTVVSFLEKANTLTPVTSGGKAWTIWVRPLLPDESGA
jgi:hypothetical protein